MGRRLLWILRLLAVAGSTLLWVACNRQSVASVASTSGSTIGDPPNGRCGEDSSWVTHYLSGPELWKEMGTCIFGGAEVCPKYFDAVRRACSDGHADACFQAGQMESDKRRARTHFERACLAGHISACDALADAMLVDGNAERAFALSAKAAALDEHWCIHRCRANCCILAGRLLNGKGVRRDPGRAVALFRKTCDDLADATSCFLLGSMYELGEEVPEDRRLAVEYYDKGCRLGDKEACRALRQGASADPSDSGTE